MEVIALRGAKGSGKTETLTTLYQLMLFMGYTQVAGCFQDLGNRDFLDVLEKERIYIGIVTQGDYVRLLPKIPVNFTNSWFYQNGLCVYFRESWHHECSNEIYPLYFYTKGGTNISSNDAG